MTTAWLRLARRDVLGQSLHRISTMTQELSLFTVTGEEELHSRYGSLAAHLVQ